MQYTNSGIISLDKLADAGKDISLYALVEEASHPDHEIGQLGCGDGVTLGLELLSHCHSYILHPHCVCADDVAVVDCLW